MGKKLLITDDSALMRRVTCDIIKTDSRYDTPDLARDGIEALELIRSKKYDAVILDVNMPRMDGLQLLRELKKAGIKQNVMMFSTTTGEGTSQTIEALELGALDFIQKPENVMDASGEQFAHRFLELLSVVSGTYLDYRPDEQKTGSAATSQFEPRPLHNDQPVVLRPTVSIAGEKIVAIASSTGGPKALQSVVPKLPANLNAPVIIVQHMPAGFTKSLAERLDVLSPISVKEAEDGDLLEKGHVYIAPGGKHMKVAKSGSRTRIYFTMEPTREGVRPAANYMYESLIDTSYGAVCCVVLTGMGADGTAGIKNLIQKKKLHIIAQDEATCAVYGMPKAIAMSGLVNEVLPLERVADAIVKNVGTAG